MGDFFKQLLLALALILLLPRPTRGQLTEFNWQPIPMRSGEIANIVWSPSDPNILYLGVEVNSHSFYKSTDGGKSWRRIDQGDHAKDVAVHPTNPDIVFYSDSQSVWRTISGGEVRLVRTGPCDPRREKCASAFQKVIENNYPPGPAGTSFSTIAFTPGNPNVVYAAVRGGHGAGPFGVVKASLFRSSDTGESFDQITTNLEQINVLMVDPADENRLFAGNDSGIHISTDGGATFTATSASARRVVDLTTVDGKTIHAAHDAGIARSTDSGSSWQDASKGLPNKTVLRTRPVRDNPNIVWSTTLSGVAKSTDGGASWQDVSSNLPGKNLQALAVDPRNPDVAIVATETFIFSVRSDGLFHQGQYYGQGIYRTEDGGKTWSRSDNGLIEEELEELTVHPTKPFEVWGGRQSSRGMYRSRDAGQSWSLSPGLLPHYPMRLVYFPGKPDKIAHTSLHIGEAFGISEDDGVNWDIQDQNVFFKSLNRGKELLNSSIQGANIHLHGLAVDPENPDVIYVGSVDDPSQFNEKALKGSHIFKSTNGGKSWVESDEGYDHTTATSIHDIKVDQTNPMNVYVATTRHEASVGNGIWKSDDSGKTWQRANQGMNDSISVEAIAVHTKKSGQLLAATEQGIFRSTDGAASWQRVHQNRVEDIEADPSNPDVVYAGGEGGVVMSTDFGESWQNVFGNIANKLVNAIAVNSSGKIVYAGVSGEGVYVAVDPSITEIPKDTGKTELGKGRGFGGPGGGGPPGNGPPGGFPSPPKFAPLALIPVTLGLAALLIWSFRKHRTLFYVIATATVILIIAAVVLGVVFNTVRKQFGSYSPGGPPGGGPGQFGGPPGGYGPPGSGGPGTL